MSMSEAELKAEVKKCIIKVGSEVRTNHDLLGKLFVRFAADFQDMEKAMRTWNKVVIGIVQEWEAPKDGGFRTS